MGKLESFYPEAIEIVDSARQNGVVFRFIGATAIWSLAETNKPRSRTSLLK